MNNTLYLAFIIFAISSCNEVHEEPSNDGSNENSENYSIDSQNLSQIEITKDISAEPIIDTQKTDSILPTPDTEFLMELDSSDVNETLKKYLDYYEIRSTYTDNCDGSYVIELENYSLEEAERILKILLHENHNEYSDSDGWYEGEYNYQGMCNLSIREEDKIVIIDFGCSC